ncbi:hypothetical protein [Gleimia coleocanis]|nr:hypothetical protein [Gleimia coleocanis]
MNDRNQPRRLTRRPQDPAKRSLPQSRGASASKRSEARGSEKPRQGSDASFLVRESWDDIRSSVVKPRRPRSTSASSQKASRRTEPNPHTKPASHGTPKNSGHRRPIAHTASRTDGSSSVKRRKRKQPTAKAQVNYRILMKISLIIISIIVAIVATWFTVSYVKTANEARKAAKIEASTDKPEVIANCQPSDLQVNISSNALTLESGSLWDAKITLQNQGIRSCYTEGGPNRYGFQIKSGEVEVFNSLKCAATDSQIPLLLGRGKSWDMELPWDGKVWVDCNPTKEAQPGTYVATLLNGDKPVGTPQVLTIVAKPTKEPAPTEKPTN